MKKRILTIKRCLLPMFITIILTLVMIPTGNVSSIPVITQTSSRTTIYLDPPTIDGAAIGVGNTVTVGMYISDVVDIYGWQAGLLFNGTVLNCTGYFEGEFLPDVGDTLWTAGSIDNNLGEIIAHGESFIGDHKRSGSGRLAYLTFIVTAPGVSDLHLRDVLVIDYYMHKVDTTIIDVYTVVLDTTHYTVVTVSNSTGDTGKYGSGFDNHAFSPSDKEISFRVTTPRTNTFSNVTIPKSLVWIAHVSIDGIQLGAEEMIITENATHNSVYFTYDLGIHTIKITSRMSSTISMVFSSGSIYLGSNVTISGNVTAEDLTARPNVNVTILYRPVGAPYWYTVGWNLTDQDSNYNYTWTPGTGGTHEVKTRWEGDNETVGDESDVLLLKVLYVFEPEPGKYVVIETNSTAAEFNSIPALNFSQSLNQISFNVTSPYGTFGFSNVTIPGTLLWPELLVEWKVVINGTLLSTEEIIVRENATHASIYFTYRKGINIVQITTRMSSIISMALSSNSTDLGESVAISGNITLEDHTMRPNANVTIHIYRSTYQPIDGPWSGLVMTETNENGSYTYVWTPEKAGIYEFIASWEGDNETIGATSDIESLIVKEASIISIVLSSTNITFGSNVTISGSIDPLKPNVAVAIQYKLIDGPFWYYADCETDQDSNYNYTWTPDTPGTYNVKATWIGDTITYSATSVVWSLIVKEASIISIVLSSTNITLGESVTISGNVTAEDLTARPNVNVTISYKLSGDVGWTTLTVVETDENGSYTYPWEPGTAGTYTVNASWLGDDTTFGNESVALTLTVKEAPAGISLTVVVAAVVATAIIIAAIAVYFVRFRKPR